MSTNELLTILISVGGSILTAFGSYKFWQGRTEEWRESVKERLKKIETRAEIVHKRTHRHAQRILTHELEIYQLMHKLGVPRSGRRDDDYDPEGREEE